MTDSLKLKFVSDKIQVSVSGESGDELFWNAGVPSNDSAQLAVLSVQFKSVNFFASQKPRCNRWVSPERPRQIE